MGFGGISIWQLLIVLLIVVLLFGTKKLRNIGGDLGSALRNFKSAVKEGKEEEGEADAAQIAHTGEEPGEKSESADSKDKEKA